MLPIVPPPPPELAVRDSPFLDGIRHQTTFHQVGVAVPHFRLHKVLPLYCPGHSGRACSCEIILKSAKLPIHVKLSQNQ